MATAMYVSSYQQSIDDTAKRQGNLSFTYIYGY